MIRIDVEPTDTVAGSGTVQEVFDPEFCPDCGGSGVAHCCDGLCEQPDHP